MQQSSSLPGPIPSKDIAYRTGHSLTVQPPTPTLPHKGGGGKKVRSLTFRSTSLSGCSMLPTASAPPSWLISQFRAGVDQTQFRRAIADLWRGLHAWPLWGYLGYHEIRQRYRRSVLGPFWITISMGVMVLALGLLYGTIFKQPLKNYLPYVTTGFIVWGLLSSFITDGLKSFIKAGGPDPANVCAIVRACVPTGVGQPDHLRP